MVLETPQSLLRRPLRKRASADAGSRIRHDKTSLASLCSLLVSGNRASATPRWQRGHRWDVQMFWGVSFFSGLASILPFV